MNKLVISSLTLIGFAAAVGWVSFVPDFRLAGDIEWDLSGSGLRWLNLLAAWSWAAIVVLGLTGWTARVGCLVFGSLPGRDRWFPSLVLVTAFFSLFAFALSVNGLLFGPLVLPFFLAGLPAGFAGLGTLVPKRWPGIFAAILLGVPALLWLLEYLSSPIHWDALQDHFRFAKEVALLHHLPLVWTDHTGDMPKFADIQLAALYSLGGETLARMGSVMAAVLAGAGLVFVLRKHQGAGILSLMMLLSCGFFLAIFTFGYSEGFLSAYELAAIACLMEALSSDRRAGIWFNASAFFLGCALGVKYTAVFALAGCCLVWLSGFRRRRGLMLSPWAPLFFLIPCLPWMARGWLAHGNPVYPLLIGLFGGAPGGYSVEMGRQLMADTGAPGTLSIPGIARTFWDAFFTSANQVGAAFTPLVLMSFPWFSRSWREKRGRGLFLFSVGFLVAWALFCTSLRHAAGGILALTAFAGLAWSYAMKSGARPLFIAGWAVSLWLAFATQLRTDAPYAAAMGLEGRDARLARHYYFDRDTFNAYRVIEKAMRPGDRVLAFGVFQTYPLRAPAFVDLAFKRPVFLQWAAPCRTAEGLATKLRHEGVRFILYQREEAVRMSAANPRFLLTGMPEGEYVRFWRSFMEPLFAGRNTIVYQLLDRKSARPFPLSDLPGLQEKTMARAEMLEKEGRWKEAAHEREAFRGRHPEVGGVR